MGKIYRCISAHEIAASLGHRRHLPLLSTPWMDVTWYQHLWDMGKIRPGNMQPVSRVDWLPCDPDHHVSQHQDDTMHFIERFVVLSMAVPVHILKLTRTERNTWRETSSSESHLPAMLWNYMWRDQSSRVSMSGDRSWPHNPQFRHQQAKAGGKQ